MKLVPFLAFLLFPLTAQAAYSVISTTTTTVGAGPLQRTVFVIQYGADTRQRFQVNRLKTTATVTPHGSIILLPPDSANYEFYEIDEGNNTYTSTAGLLATNGVDVWGYSPRSRQIPGNACGTATFDCSLMNNWGIATIIADVLYIRGQVLAAHPGQNPIIGGYDTGAAIAMALMNNSPTAWSGAWLFEGFIKSNSSPATVEGNNAACFRTTQQLTNGRFEGGLRTQEFKYLRTMPTASYRDAATTSFLSSKRTFIDAFISSYQATVGTINITSGGRISPYVLILNYYESLAVFRDISCSLAQTTTTFTASLSSFTAPLMLSGGDKGNGALMPNVQFLVGTPSNKVTLNILTNQGGLEPYLDIGYVSDVSFPLKNFVLSVFP